MRGGCHAPWSEDDPHRDLHEHTAPCFGEVEPIALARLVRYRSNQRYELASSRTDFGDKEGGGSLALSAKCASAAEKSPWASGREAFLEVRDNSHHGAFAVSSSLCLCARLNASLFKTRSCNQECARIMSRAQCLDRRALYPRHVWCSDFTSAAIPRLPLLYLGAEDRGTLIG